jgi:2-dehydropantoate 2-reductase
VRIAIMGAGGVGAYYGACLALAGEDVVFVARGAHLQALRSRGLRVISDEGALTLDAVTAVEDTRSVGTVDAVLFAVKLYDAEVAAKACLPLLGESTYVVSVQNGVESVDILSRILGPGRVLGGATYIVASIDSPGVIRRTGPWARIEFAEPTGELTARARQFERACRRAGIDIELSTDMAALLWNKFVLLSATSATTALTRQPIGYVREDEVMWEVAAACVAETVAVGRALGVALNADAEAAALRRFEHELSADAKASQLVDLERGKPLELEYLSGAIHRFGKRLGVPTPVHTTVYAALRPFVNGARG